MRLLKALSLFAALALLSGAVIDAQTGLVRQVLSKTPDAGKKARLDDSYLNATKAGPLIRERDLEPAPQPTAQQAVQQAEPTQRKDAGK